MARSRLPKDKVRRIRNWQAYTAEALDGGDGGIDSEKDCCTNDEEYRLDACKARGLELCRATAFTRATALEEGRIDLDPQHKTSGKFGKGVKRGAKVVFAPVSLPVRAILYAQRHWEEFLWGKLEAAVQRFDDVKVPKLHLHRKSCAHLCSQDETDALRASRKADPGVIATNLPSLAGSKVPVVSHSPLEPMPVSQDDLTALSDLEEGRLDYSHLPLAHALNTTSSWRAQQLRPFAPTNGTISRLGMSREELERQTTKDTADYSPEHEDSESPPSYH